MIPQQQQKVQPRAVRVQPQPRVAAPASAAVGPAPKKVLVAPAVEEAVMFQPPKSISEIRKVRSLFIATI